MGTSDGSGSVGVTDGAVPVGAVPVGAVPVGAVDDGVAEVGAAVGAGSLVGGAAPVGEGGPLGETSSDETELEVDGSVLSSVGAPQLAKMKSSGANDSATDWAITVEVRVAAVRT